MEDTDTDTATACRPQVEGRTPTGEPQHGPRASAGERNMLGRTNYQRCFTIWSNLRGAASDFDDLDVALAQRLGWVNPGGLNLPDLLEATSSRIDAAPWAQVRRAAVDVFFERYSDDCFECGHLDWRTLDELADDQRFTPDGVCRLCELDDVTPPSRRAELHGELARALASHRISWRQVHEAAQECPVDEKA